MASTRHTPGCRGREVPLFRARDRNQRVDVAEFLYLRCEICGLIRLAEPPEDLGRYYPNAYYEIPTFERLTVRAAKDTFRIDTVRRYSRPQRLLEIGAGWGTFAFQAKQAGYQVDAVEMDKRCCEFLDRSVGVRTVCSVLPHEAIATLGPHEVIALWHVIEHLADPWALLTAAAANLTPGGILVLATPNPDALQFRIMGADWPHVDAPRHLYLLPRHVLIGYVEPLGLVCVAASATNEDARAANRFGWQKLLMNRVEGRWLTEFVCKAGRGVAALFAPFETRDFNGSSYTLILRKGSSEQ